MLLSLMTIQMPVNEILLSFILHFYGRNLTMLFLILLFNVEKAIATLETYAIFPRAYLSLGILALVSAA